MVGWLGGLQSRPFRSDSRLQYILLQEAQLRGIVCHCHYYDLFALISAQSAKLLWAGLQMGQVWYISKEIPYRANQWKISLVSCYYLRTWACHKASIPTNQPRQSLFIISLSWITTMFMGIKLTAFTEHIFFPLTRWGLSVAKQLKSLPVIWRWKQNTKKASTFQAK